MRGYGHDLAHVFEADGRLDSRRQIARGELSGPQFAMNSHLPIGQFVVDRRFLLRARVGPLNRSTIAGPAILKAVSRSLWATGSPESIEFRHAMSRSRQPAVA